MAAAVSFSRVRALPTWSSSVSGDDDHRSYSAALAMSVSVRPRCRARSPARMMGNVNAGKGLFAPLVVVARNIIGRKRFNQLRGKAIALHSQVALSLSLVWLPALIHLSSSHLPPSLTSIRSSPSSARPSAPTPSSGRASSASPRRTERSSDSLPETTMFYAHI